MVVPLLRRRYETSVTAAKQPPSLDAEPSVAESTRQDAHAAPPRYGLGGPGMHLHAVRQRGRLALAEANQREVAEWRDGTALDQPHVVRCPLKPALEPLPG